jgi:hypothetical protein
VLSTSARVWRLVVCIACLGAATVSTSKAQDQNSETSRLISFNIPRQPMGSALAAFGAATRLEVIADARVSRGRLSSSVVGAMPVGEALATLVAGTGLISRIDDFGNVRIKENSEASELQFSPVRSPYASYFAAVQRAALDAACEQEANSLGEYRLVFRMWIAPTGAVERLKFLDTTGNRQRDETLARALYRIRMAESLPPGLIQPITLVIVPRARRDDACSGEIRRAFR